MADADPHLALVAMLTERFGEEARAQREDATIPWESIPTMRAMTVHVGNTQRWAASVIERRRPVRETDAGPSGDLRAWYADGREHLLDVLRSTEPDEPCWVLGGRQGTVGFWRRRMVYEHAKHLIDARASDGRGWSAAPELTPSDYADGIDELFSEFLPRTRASLPRLAGPIRLSASDAERTWLVAPDWHVSSSAANEAASITATAGDLALLVWERAALRDASRFDVRGDPATVEAFATAVIHPW